MTQGLERWHGGQDLHFITCSCYHRQAELGSPERRDLFLRVLEHARLRYRFVVIGYVVMPEHFHLLITEPEVGNPSVVMKVIKERFTKLLRRQPTHPKTADEWGTRTSTGPIGRSGSTTLMLLAPRNGSKNSATCTKIR